MGIKYKVGNAVDALRNGDISYLAHGVNCQGAMNSGIAKEIRNVFPKAFESYRMLFVPEWTQEKLGTNQYVEVIPGGVVINCFTQNTYGYEVGTKYCSYDAIDKCMKNIADETEALGSDHFKIGMPQIGSKRGGGNWNVIESIINSRFKEREIYVYVLSEERHASSMCIKG